eukprot:1505836-Karenia_brevis.AAC.1
MHLHLRDTAGFGNRDAQTHRSVASAVWPPRAHLPQSPLRARSSPQSLATTVSYTHLRAHETLSDL